MNCYGFEFFFLGVLGQLGLLGLLRAVRVVRVVRAVRAVPALAAPPNNYGSPRYATISFTWLG